MADIDAAIASAKSNREAHLSQLKEFLAIPSISTLSERQPDIQRAADWLANRLRDLGFDGVEIVPTQRHPVVYGEWLKSPGKPTVAVYGHYDVQPVDPIDEWTSDPFQPTVRGEDIFARGAADMKGQIISFLQAVEILVEHGGLPVNLKILWEGEEEIGSPSLPGFLDKYRERLDCDAVLVCDAPIESPDTPALDVSLRGNAFYELEVRGPKKDLHSGVFGGSVHNPLQVLCELIAGMHDEDGRVTLPGFYDKVRELPRKEREELLRAPYSDEQWKGETGVSALWGEKGYSTLERVGTRPTLEICGVTGGFTGEGAKTVIPARALAKISTRLVPNQDSGAVYEQLSEYLRRNAPETISWALRELHHAPASAVNLESSVLRAAARSLEEVWGVPPIYRREGGSVPVVGLLQSTLGSELVLMGFAMPTDGIHGPNEKLHLPNFFRGIETYIRFLGHLPEVVELGEK